jgi:hypothetical protein
VKAEKRLGQELRKLPKATIMEPPPRSPKKRRSLRKHRGRMAGAAADGGPARSLQLCAPSRGRIASRAIAAALRDVEETFLRICHAAPLTVRAQEA